MENLTFPTPRLIALDLDGTLLTSERCVSPRTRRALETLHRQGVQILICTGRPRRTAEPVLVDLALGDTAALYNGALVVDTRTGRILKQFTLEPEHALRAIRAVKRAHPEAMAAVETVNGWFTDDAYYRFRTLHSELLVEPTGVGALEHLVDEPVVKVLFRHPEATSSVLARSLRGLPVHPTWAFTYLLEVSAKNVTKANTLRWLCAELGIGAERVAAFGDQNNDKEMLAWAGLGVAMGNAVPEAKAAADLVTLSNDEDGVAHVLEAWTRG